MKKNLNLYLAGKVKVDPEKRLGRSGGWRYQLIKDLFDVEINFEYLNYSEYDFIKNPEKVIITKINDKFNYVGAYLYGCDHGCSHKIPYAHGISTCSTSKRKNDDLEQKYTDVNNEYDFIPNLDVLKISLAEIDLADIIIVNFNEMPLESYGTLTEVGYAYGKGKKIFGFGEHIPELWFNQGMCKMCKNIDILKKLLFDYSYYSKEKFEDILPLIEKKYNTVNYFKPKDSYTFFNPKFGKLVFYSQSNNLFFVNENKTDINGLDFIKENLL